MHTTIARLVAFVLLTLAPMLPAEARRVALIIGNSEYRHVDRLPNPVNDATEIGRALERLQFDKVTVMRDLGKDAMSRALQSFEEEANGADIAIIYYAGHGIEVDGQNYLIPTDARLARATAVEFEALELSKVSKRIEGAKKLRLVILDACRNNPFRGRMASETTGRRRSIGRGLGLVEPGENELVAFAAAHGTEADDGNGQHSPYTVALLKHIETPGLEIGQLFREVRDEVLTSTNRGQTPHLYGTLGRDQIFLKPRSVAAAGKPDDGQFDVVRKRLEELETRFERQLGARAVPQQEEPSSQAARKADDDSRQSLILLQQLAAERNRADQATRAAEEAQRKAAEADTLRLAALQRREPAPGVVDPAPLSGADRERITRDVQSELRRVGCYPGNVDGRWGEGTRVALGSFSRNSGRPVTDEPSLGLLDMLRSFTARVCPLQCDDGEVVRNGQCVEIAQPRQKPKVDPRAAARERAERNRAAQQAAARERTAALAAARRSVKQRVLVERRVARPAAPAATGGGGGRGNQMCFPRTPSGNGAMVPCSDPRAM